ncbi:MAG: glucoamylase family protein, partial [Betaproteobacteria bacterium]
MKISEKFIGQLGRLQALSRRDGSFDSVADEEPPLRSELFNAEQMAQHGKHLAATHRLIERDLPDRLLSRLTDNERLLTDVCQSLVSVAAEKRGITPAGEWLLDNFYLIEEQIRTAKRHLPKRYSRQLPRLLHGPSAGQPRVYDIALETIAHGDARVDPESLSRFIVAYQTVTTLTLGELWAIPIMLRLALIENLRRVAARIAAGRKDRDLAASWARKMTGVAENDPRNLILVIADMARSRPPLTSSFVAELARQLHGRGAALALPLSWIEQGLAESHQTIEQLVQSEAQQQAADQVSIGNSIGSLRFLGAMDWNGFVETMSVVEQTLRCDPAGIYSRMDFATRDRYRHVVERLAKGSGTAEAEVAKRVVRLAHHAAAAGEGGSDETAHVGYYLIDQGLRQLESSVGFRLSLDDRVERRVAKAPLLAYLGGALLLTLVLGSLLLMVALADGATGIRLVPLAALLLLGLSHSGLSLVNWPVSLLVSPRALPRLDFSNGIPTESRTLVVVPSMLGSAREIELLLEGLEVRFLANRDDCLHFALLTDFRDAPQEKLPEDEALLRQAAEGIAALNAQYSRRNCPDDDPQHNIFFLLHRPRRWNPAENAWMGRERKRGKLGDLNALLRGRNTDAAGQELFSGVVGDLEILQAVRYVITLDTDTQLPRDAARELVGAMAHPLNQARYDDVRRIVRQGYGILQPRVDASLAGSNVSHYARIFGSTPGIDPYSRASSDVYQDVFDEGSFIGKGIYDVDAFERVLGGRFPANRILSHDLLEGCYARSGLISDVPLYEDYPPTYELDVSRRHRWIRGDWQLLAWLFGKVPVGGGRREENPLSALSQWKIFDNLRRSLISTALTALLIFGWLALSPTAGALWTLLLLVIIIVPGLLPSVSDFLRKPPEVLIRQHLLTTARAVTMDLTQTALTIVCLPFDAYFSLDAILRTLWRMLRRRHLLEWKPAGGQVASRGTLAGAFGRMWIAPVVALAVAAGLMAANPMTLGVAFPILVLWAISPAVMWWSSLPRGGRPVRLSASQTRFLRKIARRTWAFFESFVGPDDRWLPPDNYQKYRQVQVAHRTSPTNIGLALLSNLTAHDFGYLPTGSLLERTQNTLETLGKMERYQGHFYNWYDTQSLQPLYPHYVSSVDSGNLVGHLLVLRTGLLAMVDAPVLHERWFDGLADTLDILLEAAAGMPPTARAAPAIVSRLLADLDAAATAARMPRRNLTSTWYALDRLQARLTETFGAPEEVEPDTLTEIEDSEWWVQALLRQCKSLTDELLFLAPWLGPTAVPVSCRDLPIVGADSDVVPSLRQLAMLEETLLPVVLERQAGTGDEATAQWLEGVRVGIAETARRAGARMAAIDRIALQLEEMSRVEYGFLYDKTRHLLAIGYNVSDRRLDASYYDLLASEARLCNFVAIAQGQLPQESWFALGRLLTLAGGEPTLLSWSGSMFEYLMPQLVMPSFENTLLDQTNIVAVKRQIAYGKQRGVPWGISESGYNVVDLQLNYQYRAFGVPGLGLKRGLAEDLVVAPYASALALLVLPQAACQNMQRLAAMGLEGRYGLFEAIDYTPVRQRRGENKVIIRSFMAHHQGMSLLAIASVLLDAPMQRRFAADPLFQATMLLLQERIPKASVLHSRGVEIVDVRTTEASPKAQVRVLTNPESPMPEVQLLSNGRYHVAMTHAGGSSSRWKDLALTRWREDGTRDNHGIFCYLRDLTDGAAVPLWSTAYQPTLVKPARYEAIFSEGRAEFRRKDGDFSTHTDIVVSPEDDIELRRVRVTNDSRGRKTIDVTSYAEVVLAPAITDDVHPAFSNLFVQTEIIDASQAIVCTRRPRSSSEKPPWMFHVVAVHGTASKASYETDRARFIGRGNTVANPQAMRNYAALSGSQGSVLDPIVAIRHVVTLEADETVTVDIVTGIAETREAVLALIAKYRDRRLADRVFDLAWTHSQVVLQLLNACEADAQLYGRLASSVIHANPVLRAPASVLARNRRGQSGLWGYAISGDLPIVLLQIGSADNIALARQLVQAHAYWHLKGLAVDLVILNEERAGYRQLLQEQIVGLVGAGVETQGPGRVFVRPVEQTSAEDRILFQSVARVFICDNQGSLEEQIARRPAVEARIPKLVPNRQHRIRPATSLPPRQLILENGLGGFTPNGREYVITTAPGQTTPAPWVNVLANPLFGSIISESGQAYTWSENAHEFRLTPWHNDPVSDSGGEVFYVRDQETGHFWSPTPLPSPGAATYVTRHGFGYSV